MTDIAVQNDAGEQATAAAILSRLGSRSIVLVGMMGVGKSSIGRRLAARLGVPFVDADAEIEKAAGMSIADIFARHGEAYFRSGEARVIARLLDSGPPANPTKYRIKSIGRIDSRPNRLAPTTLSSTTASSARL